VCVRACVCACVRACVCACVRACVPACLRACVVSCRVASRRVAPPPALRARLLAAHRRDGSYTAALVLAFRCRIVRPVFLFTCLLVCLLVCA
jgi:hypothetical protein